jgi:hypothetical protein
LAFFGLATQSVRAHQSPANCNANRSSIDIVALSLCITNGGTARFQIDYENEGAGGCDITVTNTCFYCPGANGLPNLAACQPILTTVPTTFPSGFPLTTLAFFTCQVQVTSFAIPNVAQVRAQFFGVLHANASDSAAGDALKEIPITVFNPCIDVQQECVNPCTPIGQPIQIRGTVRNCGDEPLVNVTANNTLAGALILRDAGGTPLATPVRLAPGATAFFTGQFTPTGNLCGPFSNTTTGRGEPECTGGNRTDSDTDVCHVITRPHITLTKDCFKTGSPGVRTINAGETYVETFTVTNDGDVAVQNVVIHDTKNGVTTDYVCSAGPLAPGASCTFTTPPISTTVADCPSITDRAVATADQVCPPDAVCPSPATVSSAQATCTINVVCRCELTINKEVACYLGNNNCGTFGDVATGVRDDSCPAFCYRFTITNPSTTVALVLTSVRDVSSDGTSADLTSQFNAGGPIAPGGSRTISVAPRTHCANTTNVVTAICTDADGTRHEVRDTNIAIVLKIDLDCVDLLLHSSIDTDGISQGEINGDGTVDPADNNHVTLPANTQNAPITLTLTLRNIGTATITVDQLIGLPAGLYDCATGTPVDPSTLVGFDLAAGASRTIVL